MSHHHPHQQAAAGNTGGGATTTGCFVYQVVVDQVRAFPSPYTAAASAASAAAEGGETTGGPVFYRGDLVCIDTITSAAYEDAAAGAGGGQRGAAAAPTGGGCVALRLSDGSGWLHEKQGGAPAIQLMRLVETSHPRVPVAVYVDNYPDGVALLRHPTDRHEMRLTVPSGNADGNEKLVVAYLPMQKLFSDVQVRDPSFGEEEDCLTYYRIQGTRGWIPDRRPRNRRGESAACLGGSVAGSRGSTNNTPSYLEDDEYDEEYDADDVPLLLREDQVRLEEEAYAALRQVEVRDRPDVGRASRTGTFLQRGDVVVVNAVRQSPYPHNGNGPFLHVPQLPGSGESAAVTSSSSWTAAGNTGGGGGGGWLFERKHFDRIMERIAFERGDWILEVQTPRGVRPLRNTCVLSSSRYCSSSSRTPSSSGGPAFPQLAVLRCDARVESPVTGVYFYRVVGRAGGGPSGRRRGDFKNESSTCWVCDRSVGDFEPTLLAPVASEAAAAASSSAGVGDGSNERCNGTSPALSPRDRKQQQSPAISARDSIKMLLGGEGEDGTRGWTADFVRGVAATIDSLEETSLDPDRNLISFLHKPDGTEIHVNYSTRTVVATEPQPSQSSFGRYKSKIQHLFSPFPDQQPQQTTPEQQQPSMKLFHCTAKQLAEILADPASSSSVGEPFPPPQQLSSESMSSWSPKRSAASSSSPMRRDDSNGIVVGSRERAPAAYDPLAQPPPGAATPAGNGESAPGEAAANVLVGTAQAAGPATSLEVASSNDEVALRSKLTACEQELARVQEHHLELLRSVRALDEKNAQEAARVLGRPMPSSPLTPVKVQPQQSNHHYHQQQQQQQQPPSAAGGSATCSSARAVGAASSLPPFAVTRAVVETSEAPPSTPVEGWGMQLQQQGGSRVPSTVEAKVPRARPLPKWRRTPRVIKDVTMLRKLNDDDSDSDENSVQQEGKREGDDSSSGEQLNRICGVCRDEFPSARCRSLHCLSEHQMYSCNYCLEVFETAEEMRSHRDRRDHW